MKKLISSISILLVITFFSFQSYAKGEDNEKLAHIFNSFNKISKVFFSKAKAEFNGASFIQSLSDESNPKVFYSICVSSQSGAITMIYVSKQYKKPGNVTELINEGIRMDKRSLKYRYFYNHYNIHRSENHRYEDLKTVINIWDEVLDKFFPSSG